MQNSRTSEVELSIVVPAHNEQDNVRPLVTEITTAIEPFGNRYEIVLVDDGSSDQTPERCRVLLDEHPHLRLIRLAPDCYGKGNGQSAAFHAGFQASHGRLIATLDADLQNDPADLPALVTAMREHNADMVQGNRKGSRADGPIRSFSSWVGRFFRRTLLGDTIIDTGCSLRVMKREIALRLPLEFRGMHRFIPLTARQLGYVVIEVPVSHRQRYTGAPKYGIWNRALPGLVDCFAVRWMRSRRTSVEYQIVERSTPSPPRRAESQQYAQEHETIP